MFTAAGSFASWAAYLFLIFLRVSSLFVLSPFLGRNVPRFIKVILSIMLSYIIIGVFPPQRDLSFDSTIEYVIACIKEISCGLIFGIIGNIFFSAVYTAGQLIDLQLGFSFAQIYDMQANVHAPLSGNLLYIILTLVFFLVDGHHTIFTIIYNTFSKIPPGAVSFNLQMVHVLTEAFVMAFALSLKIAMPILAISLVVEAILGIIMRAVPQLNFFVIGFPVKIFIGLFTLLAFIPIFINATNYIFDDMYRSIMKVFEETGVV